MGKTTIFGKKALLLSSVSSLTFFALSASAQDKLEGTDGSNKANLLIEAPQTNSNNTLSVTTTQEVEEIEENYIYLDVPQKKEGYLSVIAPFGSWHGATPPEGETFTEFNPGIGLAYTRNVRNRYLDGQWTTSAAVFEDSYGLFSGILRTNYSEEVPGLDWLHVGATLALAYKGTDFNQSQELIAAPLFHVKVDITDRLSISCLLYTSPSPRDKRQSRMPSSA